MPRTLGYVAAGADKVPKSPAVTAFGHITLCGTEL
jgi:hypothetical protein